MRFVTPMAVLCLLFSVACSNNATNKTNRPNTHLVVEEILPEWQALQPLDIALDVSDPNAKPEIVRNFYFIMDGSGSMNEALTEECGGGQTFGNKMLGAKWALEQFMSHVPDDVKIGLYVFDQNGQGEVLPLGLNNREAFNAGIRQIKAGQGTPLARAIMNGTDKLVEEYKKQLGYGEFRLVVITDGEARDIPKAALYAAKRGIPIYTIGLCVGAKHPLRHYSVSYQAADNFDDLTKGLQDTLAELPDFDATDFAEVK